MKAQTADYASIIQPERIEEVQKLIDSSIADVSNAGIGVENAYGEKATLHREIYLLESEIKVQEATAFMQIGADNLVTIDGKSVKLSNGEMRDMYRRYVTSDLRKELAAKEGQLKFIETNLFLAKERWEEAKVTSDLVQSKAYVQANLLKFLSGRG